MIEKIEMAVLVYPEEEYWVARALDFDVIGSGKTPLEAVKEMNSAFQAHLEHLQEMDWHHKLLRKSPEKYWKIYNELRRKYIEHEFLKHITPTKLRRELRPSILKAEEALA